jgi:threonine/homoserine/homoserine lactone efflux protein
MITPSMLNMTAAKISLSKGKKEAVKFAVGVSVVVIVQAYLAILFTKFLSSNPDFVLTLQKISILIFGIFSFYFFQQSIKEKRDELMVK